MGPHGALWGPGPYGALWGPGPIPGWPPKAGWDRRRRVGTGLGPHCSSITVGITPCNGAYCLPGMRHGNRAQGPGPISRPLPRPPGAQGPIVGREMGHMGPHRVPEGREMGPQRGWGPKGHGCYYYGHGCYWFWARTGKTRSGHFLGTSVFVITAPFLLAKPELRVFSHLVGT